MKKFVKIFSIFSLLVALLACTKEEGATLDVVDNPMRFGLQEITQTKVAYDDQTNGGISAKFKDNDQIGVYAFYNNFYYYYDEYASLAESVLFNNQLVTINVDINDNVTTTYSPLKSWTFSTIYGTAPHTLDAVAYYPFHQGDNPKYVKMTHESDGTAYLEYYYVGYKGDDDKATEVVNSDVDFMTASQRYDGYSTPNDFREAMLALENIPFTFTRRMASLNLKVTKPDGYDYEIVVDKITIYFDADTKFTQKIMTKEVAWGENRTGLTTSRRPNKALVNTGWTGIPGEDVYQKIGNLLDMDDMLFFPPETEISKVVFDITDDNVKKTYTWHPHIESIVANKHYSLNLELDPNRAN